MLTAVTSDVTNNIEVGMIIQLSFNHSFKIVKIDKHTNKDATSASTLGTVVALYRKWSFKERSLSKETPLTITKDKLPVIHPMKNCESLNLQYASNLPSSSADLKATNNGWPSNPTRKLEKARQNISVNDGE